MEKLTREYAEKLGKDHAKKMWGVWVDEVVAGDFGCDKSLGELSEEDHTDGYMKAIEETNVAELLEALKALMKEYKSIADSGDCGWWDAEEQDEYIKAKNAINKFNTLK